MVNFNDRKSTSWFDLSVATISPKGVSSKRRRLPPIVIVWLIVLLFVTLLALLRANRDEYSGLRTLWRRTFERLGANPEPPSKYAQVASSTFRYQGEKAKRIFKQLLAHQSVPAAMHYDICPVVLSTVERTVPHWVWTVASLLQGIDENHDVGFSVPTVIWRGEAAYGGIGDPEAVHTLRELQRKGFLRTITSQSSERMPPFQKFAQMAFSRTPHENQHFAKQAFDHVMAMQDCMARKCSFCLVLEDDLVISSSWRKRLSDAFKHRKEASWGVLKLFELEEGIRVADPVQGWEKTDVPCIIIGALTASSFFTIVSYYVLKQQVTFHQRRLCSMFAGFFLWSLIIVALLGSSFMFPPTINDPGKLQGKPLSYRMSRYPTRGAVANIYRFEDLEPLTKAIDDHIHFVTDDWESSSPSDDARRAWLGRFGDTFAYSSDVLRIDVIVAKYFMFTKQKILVLEPNVVQHIGFVSTEPLRKTPFTAMTSTFEDILFEREAE